MRGNRRVDWYESTLVSGGALHDDPERACRLKQALEGLSAEALEVVNLVLEAPGELLEWVVHKGTVWELTRSDVRVYLRWRGWPWKRIRGVWEEVGAALKKI